MSNSYRLLDFGEGRKLESLGGYVIDRPCPAAEGSVRRSRFSWQGADARYDRQAGEWIFHRPWPEDLQVVGEGFVMPLAPRPFGHIGLFPEQSENWRWLAEVARAASTGKGAEGAAGEASSVAAPQGLNLFGYTGASSLAMVAAGMTVVHVDAARPHIEAARRAAAQSGLAAAPLRLLVDDARKFVARELRRARRYRIVVLDPPAYGHAPRGKAWRLERDLWPLLEQTLRLFDRSGHLLITGHSPSVGPAEVGRWLREHWEGGLQIDSGRATLKDPHQRDLDAGFYVRAALHSQPTNRGRHRRR